VKRNFREIGSFGTNADIIFVSQPMSNNQITFNTSLSDPIKTRADFNYKIIPTLISITDTGLASSSLPPATPLCMTTRQRRAYRQLLPTSGTVAASWVPFATAR